MSHISHSMRENVSNERTEIFIYRYNDSGGRNIANSSCI